MSFMLDAQFIRDNLEAVKIGNRCAAGHVQQLADTTLAAGLR